MEEKHYQQKSKMWITFFLLFSIVECVIAMTYVFRLPSDPQHALFFGLSKGRLFVVGAIFLIFISIIVLFSNREKFFRNYCASINNHSQPKIKFIKWTGILTALLLWFIVWFPTERLGKLEEEYIRLLPFILLGIVIIFQFSFLILWISHELDFKSIASIINRNKKFVIAILTSLFLIGILFYLLRMFSPSDQWSGLHELPGTPLSSLQVFLSVIPFAGLLLLSTTRSSVFLNHKWLTVAFFFLIWILTFLAWSSAQLPCHDDLLGPYPPNDTCSVNIDDAVFTIGSHYVSLGQGINNQWMTDKPLYMVFLAIGQWIFGPQTDNYLIFQILVLSVCPAILFIVGKRLFTFSYGLLLALLVSSQEYFSIILYRYVGNANVKVESSEILVIFFLVILLISCFNWFRHPKQKKWAVISGGILGLASLIRFNPLLILPLLLLVFACINRKTIKNGLVGISIFMLAFCIAVIPCLLSSSDTLANNVYIAKIQGILTERYQQTEPAAEITQTQNIESQTISVGSQNSESDDENLFASNSDGNTAGVIGIFYHLLHNEFTALIRLPANFSFLTYKEIVAQPIWIFSSPQPIWKYTFSVENIFGILASLGLLIIGVAVSVKKFGVAGLTGLIIQTGYFLGTAAAQTSGGRYIVPVYWITLLYYCIGILTITILILTGLRLGNSSLLSILQRSPEAELENNEKSRKRETRMAVISSIVILVLGLSVAMMNYLPTTLPPETGEETNQLAYDSLVTTGIINTEEWNAFLNHPNHLVVEGAAFNPKYYRSANFLPGTLSFELLVLSRQHVYVNYLGNVIPNYFSDGSSVLLVGCKMGSDYRWGADRIIMESYAVIQRDHEQAVYINPSADWVCK